MWVAQNRYLSLSDIVKSTSLRDLQTNIEKTPTSEDILPDGTESADCF